MDFTAIIKTVAPWIGTALTGPLGGMAIGWACDALGVENKTTESLQQALAGATPEQMLALKVSDQGFALKMQELGFENLEKLEGLAVEDRKDARAMQTSTKSNIPALLSVLVVSGYFAILVGMMLGELKVSESQALLLMLGSLSTSFGVVMAFWFGTTSSSARKTELLAKAPAVQ